MRVGEVIRDAVKRAVDIAGSAVGLLLFSPVMLWAAIRIRREMGPPAMFNRERAGKGGAPFKLYKFRSMSDARDEHGELLPDEARLTDFGRVLRSSSIDELPQLLNVLRGEMSLVGPRPLLLEYVSRYSAEQRRRLDVKPGITGWAQVNGRNALTWPQKFALDVWYVDNRSFLLDMKILFMTVATALRREGISAAGEATMPAFMGETDDEKGV